MRTECFRRIKQLLQPPPPPGTVSCWEDGCSSFLESRDLCSRNFLILTLRPANHGAAAPVVTIRERSESSTNCSFAPSPTRGLESNRKPLGSVSNSSYVKTSGLWVFGCGTFRTAIVSHLVHLPRNPKVLFKLLPRRNKPLLLPTFSSLGSWFGFYRVEDRAPCCHPQHMTLQRRADWGTQGIPLLSMSPWPQPFLLVVVVYTETDEIAPPHFSTLPESPIHVSSTRNPNAIVETPRLRNTACMCISVLPCYLRLKTLWSSSEWEKQND